MFRQIGAGEILLILAVLILLFGAKKLPELARSLGKSARELRKGMEDDEDDDADDEATMSASDKEDPPPIA
jgi:sec-independent protein translocase protein TatA